MAKQIKKAKRKRSIQPVGLFKSFFDGSIFSREEFIRSLPFISFLAFLGLIYIANTYYAEKTVEKIDRGKKELNLLRNDFVSTRSRLMHATRQSEIASKLEIVGLVETTTPPKKIIIKAE